MVDSHRRHAMMEISPTLHHHRYCSLPCYNRHQDGSCADALHARLRAEGGGCEGDGRRATRAEVRSMIDILHRVGLGADDADDTDDDGEPTAAAPRRPDDDVPADPAELLAAALGGRPPPRPWWEDTATAASLPGVSPTGTALIIDVALPQDDDDDNNEDNDEVVDAVAGLGADLAVPPPPFRDPLPVLPSSGSPGCPSPLVAHTLAAALHGWAAASRLWLGDLAAGDRAVADDLAALCPALEDPAPPLTLAAALETAQLAWRRLLVGQAAATSGDGAVGRTTSAPDGDPLPARLARAEMTPARDAAAILALGDAAVVPALASASRALAASRRSAHRRAGLKVRFLAAWWMSCPPASRHVLVSGVAAWARVEAEVVAAAKTGRERLA